MNKSESDRKDAEENEGGEGCLGGNIREKK